MITYDFPRMAPIEGKRVKRNLLQAFNRVENNQQHFRENNQRNLQQVNAAPHDNHANEQELDLLAAEVAALRVANE